MENFDAAIKWNGAVTRYNEDIDEILRDYCSKLHEAVKHKDCFIMHNHIYIMTDDDEELSLTLDIDGMKYVRNCIGEPSEIPCEDTLPTIDEIIEELELERIDEK